MGFCERPAPFLDILNRYRVCWYPVRKVSRLDAGDGALRSLSGSAIEAKTAGCSMARRPRHGILYTGHHRCTCRKRKYCTCSRPGMWKSFNRRYFFLISNRRNAQRPDQFAHNDAAGVTARLQLLQTAQNKSFPFLSSLQAPVFTRLSGIVSSLKQALSHIERQEHRCPQRNERRYARILS